MRMRLFFALLWLVFAVETLPQPPKSLVVTHISVVDVSTGETKPDMTVIISNGRIREIGRFTTARIPEAAQVVEAGGKFLIPGLWDMHVHIFNQISRRPPNTWYFPLFIANGVTSVREMWTKLENMPQVREWRRLQLDGSLIAPRIAAVGTLVDGPAGVETTNLPALQPGPTANSVSTPEEAKKQAIPFAGHVPFLVDAAEASSAGQRSMEHLNQILESSSSRSHELFQVPGREWSSKYDKL